MRNLLKVLLSGVCFLYSISPLYATITPFSQNTGVTPGAQLFLPDGSGKIPQQVSGPAVISPGSVFDTNEIIMVGIQLDLQKLVEADLAIGGETYQYRLAGDPNDGSANTGGFYDNTLLDWEYYFVPTDPSLSSISGYYVGNCDYATDNNFCQDSGEKPFFDWNYLSAGQIGGFEAFNLVSGNNHTFGVGHWDVYINIEGDPAANSANRFHAGSFEIKAIDVSEPGILALFGLGVLFLRRRFCR